MRVRATFLLLAFCIPIAYSSGPVNVSENKFGLMLMGDAEGHSDGRLFYMRLSREMIGEWSYVRTGGGALLEMVDNQVSTFIMLRAMKMIPTITAMRVDDEYYDPEQRDRPLMDPDGSLTTFGAAYETWARMLYERGMTIPYFEFGNEVNAGYLGRNPELYARMCISVSQALKRVDPNISFGTSGMAGNGADMYDAMLTAVPELVQYVDHWGLHPYAMNHPPGYTEHLGDYGLGSHRQLAEVLAKHRVENPVFIMTETGYELGNHRNRSFPKITEENRAEYMAYAYRNIWLPDPRVRGVMLFAAGDVRWDGWKGWDLFRNDYSLTPMYEALRDIPKPKGVDFMPQGTAKVRGQIVEHITGRPVEDYIVRVWAPYRGTYAAITDPEGRFVIENIPAGEWTLEGFRDSFEDTFGISIALKDASDIYVGTTRVGRPGMMTLDTEGEDYLAKGWNLITGATEALSLDPKVARSSGRSQRIDADGRRHSIWEITSYESVIPGKVYAAEVWIKAENLVVGKGEGISIEMELTDSFAQRKGGARVTYNVDGDTDWRPLTVVFDAIPTARRNRIYLSVEAESGTVWFDDLFLHYADWPLPSVLETEPGTHGLRGNVFGPRGERIQNAIVCTSPGGYWTTTDYLGMYRFTSLPPGEYDIWAFEPGLESRCIRKVGVPVSDREIPHDIHLAFEPVPNELNDPGFENIPKLATWFTGWKRYGCVEGISASGWHRNTGIPDHPEGFQARSGKGFYGAVAGSNIKDGMIYQTIACEPDALYEVSVWHYTYQTNDGVRGDVANRLGVDPMGEENPDSPYVLFTPYTPSQGEWSRLSLRVRPLQDRMTVFLHHLQVHGLVFNCNLFDDVEVRKLEE